MAREGKWISGLWQRETGRLQPKRFADAVKASRDFVYSLHIQKRLQKHRGCVNTLSFNEDGSILMSGSDDRMIALWNWDDASTILTFHSGHSDNILHAQFMPYTDDQSIITCGADGEVRHSQILEGDGISRKVLAKLKDRVHKMAVEPGCPHKFYSCAEDGSVLQFDLRTERATELFQCCPIDGFVEESIIGLYAIAIDPRNPNYFAVAGTDQFARIYDIRKYNVDGSTNLGLPTDHFCPPHMILDNKDGITGLAFSQSSELLASYSYDNIYLFSRNEGLMSNNINLIQKICFDDDGGVYYSPSDCPSPSSREWLLGPRAFKGHRNRRTIKGVSFLGPNCEYVTSGSDSGHIFIWRKKDGEIIRVMDGDKRVVNCIEPHPLGTAIASSGIESDIKIWTPSACLQPSDHCDLDINQLAKDEWSSDSSDFDGYDYPDDGLLGVGMDLDFDDENGSYEEDDDGMDDDDDDGNEDSGDDCDEDVVDDYDFEEAD